MQDTVQNSNDPQDKNLNQHSQSPVSRQSMVSAVSKEQEAVSIKPVPQEGASKTVPEISLSAPSEVSIPPELKSYIEKGSDAKEPVLQKPDVVGVPQKAPSGDSVLNTAFGRIKLPMSYQRARDIFKKTGTSDSMHWLASLVMYQWLKYNPDSINQSGRTTPQS